jgi:hypothetical protein
MTDSKASLLQLHAGYGEYSPAAKKLRTGSLPISFSPYFTWRWLFFFFFFFLGGGGALIKVVLLPTDESILPKWSFIF